MVCKKNSPGKPCCECCIDRSELPTVTIGGMTAPDWTDGGCCWIKVFTPDTPPAWTKTCSGTIWTWNEVKSCTTETMLQSIPYFPLSSSDDFPTSLTDCLPDMYSCGDLTTRYEWNVEKRLVLKYRLKKITVRIAKDEIVCDYESPVCKYSITSIYTYEAGVREDVNSVTSTTYTDSIPPGSCCENLLEDSTTGSAFNCSTAADAITTVADYSFTRVKLYDELPTGSVTFTNSDSMPSNCEGFPCSSSLPYITQVCFQSEPTNPPDLCTETPTYTTTPAQLQYCTRWVSQVVGFFDPGVCDDGYDYRYRQWTIAESMDYMPELGSKEITFTHISSVCGDLLPCSMLTYTETGYNESGCFGATGCCSPDGSDIPVGGCDCYYSFTDMCCYLGQNTGFENCYIPKAYVIGYNVTGFTYTNTRTAYSAQSLCIAAPSWTILLS